MGIDTRMASYKTYYSGTAGPDHEPPARRPRARRHARRAGRDVLAQRGDRREDGRAWLPVGSGDHRQRVRRGGRRRHVAGRDDRVQRRLGGGAQDHRAKSALPLHQPLPARPRRDRLLAVTRSQVRERHRHLGARQGIRRGRRDQHRDLRRRVAPRRELGVAAGGHRPRSRRARRGSRRLPKGKTVVEEEGSAPTRTSATRKVYSADGELHPLGDVDDVVQGRGRASFASGTKVEPKKPKPVPPAADGRARRPTDEPGATADEASAVAIASASHAGHAGRPIRLAVDRRVPRVAVRDELAVPLDPVLVAEASAAHVDAARPDRQRLVEVGRAVVADAHLGRRAPRCRGRGSTGSRPRGARGTRRARPRARRRTTRGARCPARRSPRSGSARRSRTRSRPRRQP